MELFGPITTSLVQALPEIERRLERKITVVGGLAVLSRLGSAAHRVTSDVDTVNRRLGGGPGQLDVLLATGATAIDGAGAMIATPTGDVRVDVLEVSEEQLNDLPADPTDRLYLLSHDWALRSATPLHVRAVGGGATSEHTVLVAEPGPLIATKLQALPNRASVKEATDLLDIVRLALDDETGPIVRAQLAAANDLLKQDAALHVKRWLGTAADRSLRLIRTTPSGSDTTPDTVALVGELLLASLTG
ncbi:hypothetical protein [Amycolatopsis sp. H20-H5]|uniref:hypothetical protein n=1 Tax=Amycolatopsis sp. H20-H5 TaxID=3046309 RepID=UPI002DB8F92A|nr:hypothetical protein [Amycolatopsis sp. H20-H5]MEC3975210.1 hypothetical protein [Amycolatopsis sp. H20-H5]